MEYLSKMPKDPKALPAGKVLVHNHVRPTQRLGMRGFRAWLDDPNGKYEICDCGWAPKLGAHYRVPFAHRGALARAQKAGLITAPLERFGMQPD